MIHKDDKIGEIISMYPKTKKYFIKKGIKYKG